VVQTEEKPGMLLQVELQDLSEHSLVA